MFMHQSTSEGASWNLVEGNDSMSTAAMGAQTDLAHRSDGCAKLDPPQRWL